MTHVKVTWHESDHPRIPAGKPTGGRFAAKGTAFVVRFKGGPGSGNFDHAGRPGQVGGSGVGNNFNPGIYHAPDKLYTHYGFEKPTPEEEERFVENLNKEIHPDVLGLYPENGRSPILAKTTETTSPHYQNRWVVVPPGIDGVDGPIAEHEFLHHLVRETFGLEDVPGDKLLRYRPSTWFDHAVHNSIGSDYSKNEDLTMMLNFYHPNRRTWTDRLMKTGEWAEGRRDFTREKMEQKIRDVDDFINWATDGKWSKG